MAELLDDELVRKYNVYADGYSDYPHKGDWSEDFGDEEYRGALLDTFTRDDSGSSLLYLHIPFCVKQCLFCICYKEITSDYSRAQDYLQNSLFREMDLLERFLDENSLDLDIREIFLGGGSPTYLKEREFDLLADRINEFCDVDNLSRFCIEIDPRHASPERLAHYTEKGINTISMGIQDFDPAVQKAINRVQPINLITRLLDSDARKKLSSINLDFLVGLPLQTPDSIQRTMGEAASLSPDRISFCFFNYAPDFREHMRKLEHNLPSFEERKKIFERGVETIMNAGYIRTGFEHFAKPNDVVADSLDKHKATYTSLGAITGNTSNVIPIGRSGHGEFGKRFLFQNFYEKKLYDDALSRGELPIYRGLKLSMDDSLRRNMMKRLRTYFSVDIGDIEKQTNSPFSEYFEEESKSLDEFEGDGLISRSNGTLTITERGIPFTEVILSAFDRHKKYPTRFNRI